MNPADLLRSGELLESRVTYEYFQASGPGGQKRNRVRSAVRCKIKLSDDFTLQVESSDHREVDRNRKESLNKLRLELALFFAKTGLSPGAPDSGFRVDASEEHLDFFNTVWIVLDRLEAKQGNLKDCAESLSLSTGRLIRFLKRNKKVRDVAQELLKQHHKSPHY